MRVGRKTAPAEVADGHDTETTRLEKYLKRPAWMPQQGGARSEKSWPAEARALGGRVVC
ncbi:unnamed protein product, partial [Amoebophrya sp. A120]|eukprot:GSA120T00008809001.1